MSVGWVEARLHRLAHINFLCKGWFHLLKKVLFQLFPPLVASCQCRGSYSVNRVCKRAHCGWFCKLWVFQLLVKPPVCVFIHRHTDEHTHTELRCTIQKIPQRRDGRTWGPLCQLLPLYLRPQLWDPGTSLGHILSVENSVYLGRILQTWFWLVHIVPTT